MDDTISKYGDCTLDELQHWGIKGMKWGRRRFQNPDGSLTPAGEKRYNKEMERLEKQKGKIADANAKKAKMEALQKEIEDMKSGKITGNENKPKSVKEMSDDELRKAKARLDMERDYQKAYEQSNPVEGKKNSAIAENAKDFWNKSIKPALMESGKAVLTDYMKDQGRKILGLDKDPPPGSVEALKKAFDKIKYQADIAENAARKTAYDNALKEPDKIFLKEKGDKTVIGLRKDNDVERSDTNTGSNNKKDKSKKTDKSDTKDDEKKDSRKDLEEEGKGLTWEQIKKLNRTIDEDRKRDEYYDNLSHSDITFDDIEELIHHGIKGQKWGVRRYQNKNGSLTPDGKKHRDEREGRNEFRVKNDKVASGGKGKVSKTSNSNSIDVNSQEVNFGSKLSKTEQDQNYTSLVNLVNKNKRDLKGSTTVINQFRDKLTKSLSDDDLRTIDKWFELEDAVDRAYHKSNFDPDSDLVKKAEKDFADITKARDAIVDRTTNNMFGENGDRPIITKDYTDSLGNYKPKDVRTFIDHEIYDGSRRLLNGMDVEEVIRNRNN